VFGIFVFYSQQNPQNKPGKPLDLNLTEPVISAFPGVLQDFLYTFFISVHSTKHGQPIRAGPTNHKTAVIKVLIQSPQ
jgi:hypothetical protein